MLIYIDYVVKAGKYNSDKDTTGKQNLGNTIPTFNLSVS